MNFFRARKAKDREKGTAGRWMASFFWRSNCFALTECSVKSYMVALTEKVAWRLRRHTLSARTVEIKIRFSDFKTTTRSKSLTYSSHTTQDFLNVALGLLKTNLTKKHRAVRLIEMGVSQLVPGEKAQRALFIDEKRQKQKRIDIAADLIRSRYGESALKRGGKGT